MRVIIVWADKVIGDQVSASRRNFLKLAGGGAVAAAFPQIVEASPYKPHNAWNVLKDFSFTDQNENQVDLASLKKLVGDKQFTISFGYHDCAGACVDSNPALGALAKSVIEPTKHIIINVKPAINVEEKNMYFNMLVYYGITKDNLITLYPESNEQAIALSVALENYSNLNDSLKHTSNITMYNNNGDAVARVLGAGAKKDLVEGFKGFVTKNFDAMLKSINQRTTSTARQ